MSPESSSSGKSYYSSKLSAIRLKQCYDLAPPRVQQYLQAEVDYLLSYIDSNDSVLELGCGYGRVLAQIGQRTHNAVGINTSIDSLRYASSVFGRPVRGSLVAMDATRLAFRECSFEVVACLQNGIAAFNVDKRRLLEQALNVTRPGGVAIFSSYSASFWDHRLNWFRLQSEAGLLGEIDDEATGEGVIVCKDGFQAGTVLPDEFGNLVSDLNVEVVIEEVDESSWFYRLRKAWHTGK